MAQAHPHSETAALVRERVLSLPERLREDRAGSLEGQFALAVGGQAFEVSIGPDGCTVNDDSGRDVLARIETDPDTWLGLDDGTLSGIDAFLDGRLRIRGNIEAAVRVQTIFEPSARPASPADLEARTLPAGRLRLSTFQAGAGEPVILLHGLGATKLSWLPLLPALAAGGRVIAVDLPGHGDSTKRRGDHYTPEAMAYAVRDMMEEAGIRRAALVGNSMGGRVALELAFRAPGRVSGLVLLGPAVPGPWARFLLGFARVVPTEIAAVPLPVRRRMAMRILREIFAEPDRIPESAFEAGADEFMRVYRSVRARMALFASVRGLLSDRPAPFWSMVRRIFVPTLLIWGERDRLVPLALGRRLAAAMQEARLEVVPGIGHVPQFEAREKTAELTTAFLASLNGDR